MTIEARFETARRTSGPHTARSDARSTIIPTDSAYSDNVSGKNIRIFDLTYQELGGLVILSESINLIATNDRKEKDGKAWDSSYSAEIPFNGALEIKGSDYTVSLRHRSDL